jgi:hypothetical protein
VVLPTTRSVAGSIRSPGLSAALALVRLDLKEESIDLVCNPDEPLRDGGGEARARKSESTDDSVRSDIDASERIVGRRVPDRVSP